MNHLPPGLPPFDDPELEKEWLSQEDALRDDSGPDSAYRMLARILREPSPDSLPPDFAATLAARVAAASSGRLETALLIGLVLAFAIVAAVVVLGHAGQLTESFSALLPGPHSAAGAWLPALAGCLGATWLLERWPRRQQPSA